MQRLGRKPLSVSDADLIVTLAREFEDLIPGYLANRGRELEALHAACAAADFAALQRIGHRMKGAGASYGFARISEFGRAIENGARRSDIAAIASGIQAYAQYLSRVRVNYA